MIYFGPVMFYFYAFFHPIIKTDIFIIYFILGPLLLLLFYFLLSFFIFIYFIYFLIIYLITLYT